MDSAKLINKLDRNNDLYNKDFLLTWNESTDTLKNVIATAQALEAMHREGYATRLFSSGLGYAIFRDNSTRTRYSFKSACNFLGLGTEELSEETSQVAHGETVRETAAMLSFLTETIGIRDDMYLGEGHKYMKEMSDSIQESYDAGILAQRPSIVNLQCDLDHPTQAMADLLHLASHYGGLDALKGKKLAMTWAYSPSYGKPLSVPQGVVGLMSRFGMDVTLAHPEGYELVDEPMKAASKFSAETGGSFKVCHSMEEAFEGADIVYPKSWAPMQVMQRRTELLRANKANELAALEQEALAQNARHIDWECTEDLMKVTRDGKALYCHCLPADISGVSCERGEVADTVFERYRLDTYREAGHKPFIIAAMILLTRFQNPSEVLRPCLEGRRRRGNASLALK
jgi:knotted carbamoyltransferase YgeW